MKRGTIACTIIVTGFFLINPLAAQTADSEKKAAGTDVFAIGFNPGRYLSLFSVKNQAKEISNSDYVDEASDDDYDTFSGLDGNQGLIDSSLEFALLSYYSKPVVAIRPVEASTDLPANNRTSEIRLAAATYKELQEIKFLTPNDRNRIGRYEGMLKFIKDTAVSKGFQPITDSEINSAIAALVSAEVDAQFNRVSFFLNTQYNAVLTRDAKTGQFILSYEGYFNSTKSTKTLSASSLDALSLEMRNGKDKVDFDQNCINEVRAQAALIPAFKLARLDKSLLDSIQHNISGVITRFYSNPNAATYNEMKDVYIAYHKDAYNSNLVMNVWVTYGGILEALNEALAQKINSEPQVLGSNNLPYADSDIRRLRALRP
ncbi:hypothetical protein AGMMS49942_18090 [Spirochaetia bacterium]|nr:hypothetical protein AGMMS49942_18090 [Spirochaetia bacterium]